MMDMKRRDALARDIILEDITSSKMNAEVLRRLRDNIIWEDDNTLYIWEEDDDYDDNDDENEFIIREGDDLSYLGYFIGRNTSLGDLKILSLPQDRERVSGFIEGISYNRSLWSFIIQGIGTDVDVGLQNLCSFFRENNNLTDISLNHCEIGNEHARDLALALSQRQVKSLQLLGFSNNNLGDEGFADIVHALWTQPQLEQLFCSRNHIGRISCEALGALMRERNSNLKVVYVPGNAIDDVGIQALVPGLCSSNNLEELTISDPITAVGLRSLSPFLQSDNCHLRCLCVSLRLGDEEATALADALKGNKSLQLLNLPHHQDENRRRNMTDAGWSAFSKLLCDTSSINNTYLSNHTLTRVGAPNGMDDTPPFVKDLLHMNAAAQKRNTMRNKEIDRQSLIRCKIFMSHPDLDMEPLFDYKLKLLPLVTGWFRKSIQFCGDEVGEWKESIPELQSRELSAVYKFVHDMPLMISDGYWTNVLNESQTKKQRLQARKRKLEMMIQSVEENETFALKRLRR